MTRFFGRLATLPFTIFVSGFMAFAKSLEEMEGTLERRVAELGDEWDRLDLPGRTVEQRSVEKDWPVTYLSEGLRHEPLQNEDKGMSDYFSNDELGGDDIKVVEYTIFYRKPDYQATLQAPKTETISYSTTEADFAALKISDFRLELDKGLDIPWEWKDGKHPRGEYGYLPDEKNPVKFSKIPKGDEKYISFQSTVKMRSEKESANYEKDQVNAIRDVREAIEGIWD